MIKIENHELGLQWRFEDYLIFFGNKKATPSSLLNCFPHFEFRSIRQTHSDIVIESSSELLEADAHFTSEALVALQIKTADCLPIFGLDPIHKNIVAIHAGWRGVESQITIKALQKLIQQGSVKKAMQWIVGPHIQKSSFEVEQDVWVKIMESVPVDFHHQLSNFYQKLKNNKYTIDLNSIVRAQIFSQIISEDGVHSVSVDTLTNLSWHSFRRDKENSGRNISFIVRVR